MRHLILQDFCKCQYYFFVELNGSGSINELHAHYNSGDLQGRANAFGLNTEIVSDDDWSEMLVKFEQIISKVRKGKPFVLFIKRDVF